jgi:hypothetical protein
MSCSVSCGGGTQKRIRDCLLPEADLRVCQCNGTNFHGCDGVSLDVRPCNTDGCPVWTQVSSK